MNKIILIIGIIFLLIGMSIFPIVDSISNEKQVINERLLYDSKDDFTDISLIMLKVTGEMGNNNWYVSDVNFNFSKESDDITEIKYLINDNPMQNYTEPFNISNDGEDICLQWCAINFEGNQSEIDGPFIFNIDQKTPMSDMTYEWRDGPGPGTWWMTFTVTATDEMSGMDRVEFYVNNELQKTIEGPGPEYIWEFLYTGGYSLEVGWWAYDKAGNRDTTIYSPPGHIDMLKQITHLTNFNVVNNVKTSDNNVFSSSIIENENYKKNELFPSNDIHTDGVFDPTYVIFVLNRKMGKNDWINSNVSIPIFIDTERINEVYYQINNGNWLLYSEALSIIDDGEYIFSLYIVDTEGQSFILDSITFKIDKTNPEINLIKERLSIGRIKFIANVYDETSGINRVEFGCVSTGNQFNDYDFPYEWIWSYNGWLELLYNCVVVWVYDNAGHKESSDIKIWNTDIFIHQSLNSFLQFS